MDNLQIHFSEVTAFIRQAKYETLKKVNTDLINLYWRIGQYITERTIKDQWGRSVVVKLAEFITHNEPDLKGFEARNLWRMKQFYEAYADKATLIPLTRQVSWTHNLIVFSKTKSDEERLFYLQLCQKERWGKRELDRQISSAYFECGNWELTALRLSGHHAVVSLVCCWRCFTQT